ADGKRGARPLGRAEKGGAVHHARPGRGHRDERPRGRSLGRARHPAAGRLPRRPAAAPRRGRGARRPALRGAAQADLGRAARGGPQGLRAAAEAGGMSMWAAIRPSEKNLRAWQIGVLLLVLLAWQLASRNPQTAFFLGEPVKVAGRIWSWFLPFGLEPNVLF